MTDVQKYENVSSWPEATYPETGSFGYPTGPLPDNICGPTGPTGPVPPPPPIVYDVRDDANVVVSPQIPLNASADVWIRVNGAGFTTNTELVFSGVQYNHQWPVEFVSAAQLRTLITPANSGGVPGVVNVNARILSSVSAAAGTFSFIPYP
jgi:hypothetical protein